MDLEKKHLVPGTILRWREDTCPLFMILKVHMKEEGNWTIWCYDFKKFLCRDYHLWMEDFMFYQVFAEVDSENP